MKTKDTIPRVTHLAQFEAVLDGLNEGLTYEELRRRLRQVSIDTARVGGGREPSGHPDFQMWSSTKDALEELMRLNWVGKVPLPSSRHRVDAYRQTSFTLTQAGKEWAGTKNLGEAREVLGKALISQHPYFREYLARLSHGPLFVPEFTETDIGPSSDADALDYSRLVSEAIKRLITSPAGVSGSTPDIRGRVEEYVRRRFSNRQPKNRKALLDAVQDAILSGILRAENLGADPISFVTISSWSRELFLTGNSRYVVEAPGGWLHWAAADIAPSRGTINYVRRGLSRAGDGVVAMLRNAAGELKTPGTELVRIYPLRGTVAFRCGVANELVDRVLEELVTKQRPSPYEIWVSAGALFDPPASERPLSIGGRKYHLVAFGNISAAKEDRNATE